MKIVASAPSLLLCCFLSAGSAWASTTGTWTQVAAPSGSGLRSSLTWQGAHNGTWNPPYQIIQNSDSSIYVGALSPTGTAWSAAYSTFSEAPIQTPAATLMYSGSGAPLAICYTSSVAGVFFQALYYDTVSNLFSLSYVPSVTGNGTQINHALGMFHGILAGADPNGNLLLSWGNNLWVSTDNGKTFGSPVDHSNKPVDMSLNNSPGLAGHPTYGDNSTGIQTGAGVGFGWSLAPNTAPWGEMFICCECTAWHSYDNGLTWECVDPLWSQPQCDMHGNIQYANNADSYYLASSFGGGNKGSAGFTIDADVMFSNGRGASWKNSGTLPFCRLLPSGQLIQAETGVLDPDTGAGWTFNSQGGAQGYYTTMSGDTEVYCPGGINRYLFWDCDTHNWGILSTPVAGFTVNGSDGTNFFGIDTSTHQLWKYAPSGGGAGLRPTVTLTPDAAPAAVQIDGASGLATYASPAGRFYVQSSSGSLTYSWSARGQGPVTFDQPLALNTKAYFTNPGWYVLTLTANNGYSSSMSLRVHVLPPVSGGTAPTITAQPTNQIVTWGQSATISVGATGSNLKYQWKRNGMAIVDGSYAWSNPINTQAITYSGTRTATLTISSTVQVVDDGATYYCEVRNAWGRLVSRSAMLGTPPVIIQGPVSTAISSGATGSLSIAASGTQPLTWQWYNSDGTVPAGKTYQSVYLPSATGTYYVVVANCFGTTLATDPNAIATITNGVGSFVTMNLNGDGYANGTLPGTAWFPVGTTIGLGTCFENGNDWYYFSHWTGGSGLVTPVTPNSSQSAFAIASGAAGQTASLGANRFWGMNGVINEKYILTVRNGFGTSCTHYHRYWTNDTIVIKAYDPPPGMVFDQWTGDPVVTTPQNLHNPTPSFIVPARDVIATALYRQTGGTMVKFK